MVLVNSFSKITHFIVLQEMATTKDITQCFLKEVWKLHGLSNLIELDRDSKWTSEFWDGLCK
jgi:hypothetical protein